MNITHEMKRRFFVTTDPYFTYDEYCDYDEKWRKFLQSAQFFIVFVLLFITAAFFGGWVHSLAKITVMLWFVITLAKIVNLGSWREVGNYLEIRADIMCSWRTFDQLFGPLTDETEVDKELIKRAIFNLEHGHVIENPSGDLQVAHSAAWRFFMVDSFDRVINNAKAELERRKKVQKLPNAA